MFSLSWQDLQQLEPCAFWVILKGKKCSILHCFILCSDLQESTPNVKWGPTQLLLSEFVWSPLINFPAAATNWIKHENSYPWPSWSTNISWYGNWRFRSFRISSTHLGSPSCAARCAYKFFFLSNSKFPPHKNSHARGRTEAGMPFLHRSRTCIKERTQYWFWDFHGSCCPNDGHPSGCHTM